MIRTFLITVLCTSVFNVNAQDIEVLNEVHFATYTDYYTNVETPSIVFTLRVVNHSKQPMPDLGVSNRSEFVNFYVNGKQSNPISLYNGLEAIKGDRTIAVGDSADYTITWVLTEDSGILTHYGNEFTVKWEYKEIFSASVMVNIEKRMVIAVKE